MKKFLLIFEDLLDLSQKSVAGPFSAESREELALRFELKQRKNPPNGICPTYCDGTTLTNDVVIYIVLMREHQIQKPEDLQKVAFQLHCDWY